MTENNEDSQFYVYILLNPTIERNSSFLGIDLKYEPFYVGKGQNARVLDHYSGRRSGNDEKDDLIFELSSAGYEPLYRKVFYADNEKTILDYERSLIRLIGTVKDGDGPLLNKQTYTKREYVPSSLSKPSVIINGNVNTKIFLSSRPKQAETRKTTIDLPQDMYEYVMSVALETKIFKLSPTILYIIDTYRSVIEALEE